jgi:hypothetical protein
MWIRIRIRIRNNTAPGKIILFTNGKKTRALRNMVAEAGAGVHLPEQQRGAAGRDDVLGAGGRDLRLLQGRGGRRHAQRSATRHHPRV